MQKLELVWNGFYVYYLKKNDEVVYVGQCQNIHSRIGTHQKEGLKDFDSCEFVSLSSYEEMMSIELREILRLRPVYNKSTSVKFNESGFCAVNSFKMKFKERPCGRKLKKLLLSSNYSIESYEFGGVVYIKAEDAANAYEKQYGVKLEFLS